MVQTKRERYFMVQKNEKTILCKDCENKAVIIEDKKYYCAKCYMKKKGIKPKNYDNRIGV
jgi:Zn finger protein HypA/HybF involved in hydrogenase expression|tara:strand:+ start:799 stop:978 length:180 start_codon:yes stop_codon:yes gene_type:complete